MDMFWDLNEDSNMAFTALDLCKFNERYKERTILSAKHGIRQNSSNYSYDNP